MAVRLGTGEKYYDVGSIVPLFLPYWGAISFLIRTPPGPTPLGDFTLMDQLTPPGGHIGANGKDGAGFYQWIDATDFSRSAAAAQSGPTVGVIPPYSSGLWFGIRDGSPSFHVFDGRFATDASGNAWALPTPIIDFTSDTVLDFGTCYTITYVFNWNPVNAQQHPGGSVVQIYLGNTVDTVELIGEVSVPDLPQGWQGFWLAGIWSPPALSMQDAGEPVSVSVGSSSDTDFPSNTSPYDIEHISAWSAWNGAVDDMDFMGDWVPNVLRHWADDIFPDVSNRTVRVAYGGPDHGTGWDVHFNGAGNLVYGQNHTIGVIFSLYESGHVPAVGVGSSVSTDDCTNVGSPSPAETPQLPPLPVPPTVPPVAGVPIPCTPQTQVGNGGTGNSGCNTGGIGTVVQYPGPFGLVPAHADAEEGETMANAALKGGIDLWVEIVHTDYPSEDQTTYRRAMVELADPPSYEGGRKAGGLLGVGDVEHGLGNEQGGFEAATVDISYADSADRLFRNLLEDQELEGDEVRIKIATIQGRLDGIPPRVIARAVAQKPRLWSSLNAGFSASDFLFSEFGPFGPGRQFPSTLIPGSIFPHAPFDSLKLALPVLYGEKSDEGATDPITGEVNPKGLVPLIYVGPESITTTTTSGAFPTLDPNLEPPSRSAVTYLLHPLGELSFHASSSDLIRYDASLYAMGTTTPVLDVLNLGLPTANANNDISVDIRSWLDSHPAGNYTVTVSAVNSVGAVESVASNAFTVPVVAEVGAEGGWSGGVNTDPYFAVMAIFNNEGSRLVLRTGVTGSYNPIPHNFRVTWTEAPQAAEYYIFMYTAGSGWDAYTNPYATATVRYKRLPATPTNSHDPAWNYFVDWTSPSDGLAWPPTAVVTTTTSTDDWDTYIVAGHAIFDVLSVYGSDLAGGGTAYESQRIRIDPGSRGDILCPFFSTWPYPTSYRDYTADDGSVYRMTVIYSRGPLSDAHKNGVINMTVNAIGIEDVGDGSGLPIVDAHAVQQHWIENFLLKDYRSGLWVTDGDHPKWEDGTAMVRSTTFAARQAFTQSRLGNRGLTVGWYAADQRVLQDWFREWNQSTDSRLGINGDGQIVVAGLDDALDPSAWPRVLHETDLFGDVNIVSGEERENVVSGVCDWDPDKKQFRGQTIVYESQRAISQYKVRRKAGNKIQSTILISEPQLRWVLQQRLRRLQDGARTVEITGKVDLLDYDVATGIRLTTIDGTGADGYVDTPMLILRRRFKVSDRLVTLTLLDLSRYLVSAEAQFAIGDGASIGEDGNSVLVAV